jgi:lipopolysaccharide biosynthesis regulator YciM
MAAKELGHLYYYGGQFSEAVAAWDSAGEKPTEYLSSLFYSLQKQFEESKISEEKFEQALRSLLKKEKDSARSLSWRLALHKLKSTSSKDKDKLIREGLAIIEKALANKDHEEFYRGEVLGDLANFKKFLIALTKSDYFEAEEKEAEAKAALREAVLIGESSGFQAQDIGPAIRFLSVMIQAEEFQKADKWVRELRKLYPKNEDLLRRHLRILVALENFKEAHQVGELALKKSYDRNHLWVVEYFAKAKIGLGKKAEAQALVKKYLEKPELQLKSMGSTRKALEKLLQ